LLLIVSVGIFIERNPQAVAGSGWATGNPALLPARQLRAFPELLSENTHDHFSMAQISLSINIAKSFFLRCFGTYFGKHGQIGLRCVGGHGESP
jgi:hypothetical protein